MTTPEHKHAPVPERHSAPHTQEGARDDGQPDVDRHLALSAMGADPPGGPSTAQVMGLQRVAGNAAVSRILVRRSEFGQTVQRREENVDPTPAASVTELIETAHKTLDVGDIKAIGNDNLVRASEPYRWDFIHALANQRWVGARDEWALEKLWGLFGDGLFAKIKARGPSASADWVASIKGGADLDRLPAVKAIPGKFILDVRQLAYGYLDKNDQYARQELADIGKPMEPPTGPPREPAGRISEMQEAAKLVRMAKAAQAALGEIQVGWIQAHDEDSAPPPEGAVGPHNAAPGLFAHGHPPYVPNKAPLATYGEVDAQWTTLQQVITGMQTKYPALFAVMEHGAAGDLNKVATGNPDAARAVLANGLTELRTHIAATKPRVAGDLAWELKPLHAQLLSGASKSASGHDWHDPALKALAEKSLESHEKADFLKTLGLATIGAAAFVLAEIGTLGAATPFLLAGGLAISGAMAVQSWEKVYDLAQAKKTSTNPQNDLVESGQASGAVAEAVLNTALAFIDLYAVAKTALKAAVGAGSKLLTTASTAGEASLRVLEGELLSTALGAQAKAQAVERAVTQLGIERTMEIMKKSAFELFIIVGDKSPVAARLQRYNLLGELGKITSEELTTRLRLLPVEAHKSADIAKDLFQLGVERLGPARAIETAGGWAAVVKSVGADSLGVKAAKAWRDAALENLTEFIYSRLTPDVIKAQGRSSQTLATEYLAAQLKGTASELGLGTAKPIMEGLGEKDLANIFQQVADRRALADSGLANTGSMAALIKEGTALKQAWTGMSALERGEKLLALANARLRELKIFEMVRFEFPKSGDGFFVWTSWTLQFNEKILADTGRFEWLLEAVQHEARHAEQVFSVARLKAPTMTVETMMKPVAEGGLGIPKGAAEAAHAAGAIEKTSAEGRQAERWFESMMGGGRADRKLVYDALDSAEGDLRFAEQQLKKARAETPADIPFRERRLTEKWRDYQRAVGNYKALAEEADAYAVQAKFNEELRNYYQALHDAQPASVRTSQ